MCIRDRCLAIRYRPMTLPTRMPILPAPTSRPACTAAAMVARSASVAASSALRLRARSAARAGLRQAIRRSSGKSGWVISARFAWSNRLICSGPSSRASAATSGARRAVTQPRPPRSRSCSIRALVIIPRSPTSTRSVNPKRSRTSVARWANAVGSAVLPATTRTATGRPTGSVSSPYSICGSPFLPSREYPRAANGQCEPVIFELDRSNSASRSGLTGALRCRSANAASMASWRSRSQSIAAYASSVLTSVRPRSAARVVSVHQRVVASFEPGRQRDVAVALIVALPADRTQQIRQAESLGLGEHRGDVAVRPRARYLQVLPGDQQRLPGQARPDCLDRCRGQRREVRQRLVPDLAVGAKRAPQQVRDVLPVLPGLGRVPTHHPGYVQRTGDLSHTQKDNGRPSLGPRRHADFAGYTRDHSGRYPCRSKHRSLLSGVVTSGEPVSSVAHSARLWMASGSRSAIVIRSSFGVAGLVVSWRSASMRGAGASTWVATSMAGRL